MRSRAVAIRVGVRGRGRLVSAAARVCAVGLALALCAPQPSAAQVKDDFVQGFIDLTQAAAGSYGDEGPALEAALTKMADGLGRWDATIARMEAGLASAIATAPPSAQAQMRATLGAAYLERGRVGEALVQLDGAVASAETPVAVHLLRGVAQTRAGRPSAAAEAFGRARRVSPDDVRAAYSWLQTADATAASAARTEAVGALLRAATTTAAAAAAPRPIDLATLTIELVDDASVDAPLFPFAAYQDGISLVQQGKYPEALTRLRAAVSNDPLVTDRALATPEARAGAAALRRGDAGAAVRAFSAVPGGGSSSEVRRMLGLAQWTDKDYAASAASFRAAVKLNADDERARLSLADVLVASGNVVEARQVLQEAATRFPASGQPQWRLGRLAQESGDQAGALEAYEAAARRPVVAGGAVVHAAIGFLRHTALDLDGAAAAYERRVALTPLLAAAHLDLGDVRLAQGRAEAALVEFLVAALLDPSHARAFASAGRVLADAGDDASAVTMLVAATRHEPNDGGARYALSRALLRLGRADEAARQLAVFDRLQKTAMEAQRRQFEENSRALQKALTEAAAPGEGPGERPGERPGGR